MQTSRLASQRLFAPSEKEKVYLDVEGAVPLERLGGPRPNLVLLLEALEVRAGIGKCGAGAGLLLLQDGPLQVDSVDALALAGLRLDLGVDHCALL